MPPIGLIMPKFSLQRHETKGNQYRVMGLPLGHNALIQFENGEWWIQHADDSGHLGEWVGNYESAEVALEALEEAMAEIPSTHF
jgi:hypothetical protein